MSTQLSTPVNRQSVEALSHSKGEPAWLEALRAKGAELAETLEWPKPEKIRIDRWNLTALGNYKQEDAIASVDELPESVRELLGNASAGLLVQRNSSNILKQLSPELQAKGVIFTDLETAAREHSDLVEKHLFQAVAQDENKLIALHSALWNGGIFLYVPKNVEVELPLQALMYNDDSTATFAPHVLLIADNHSRVTYVDNVTTAYTEAGQPLAKQMVVEVFVKPGAHVRYATIHNMADNIIDLTIRRAVVENDARVEWIVGDLNDGHVLSDTQSILRGKGSSSDAKAITVGRNAQQMSLTTGAVHIGRSSESNMVTRAVMKDKATAIINGITKIEKGATKANGVQTEKVLMLSPKARGDANPILLIDEDDVKAGHAASVGQVNVEQVYYLMSRGITKKNAERLIIHGFLAPVVSEIPIEAVREQLQHLLERKLEG
ncbi:FeS cluster assembly protein SufD [Paenibacillus baekrokdamisoli]|uniref:FeS cluster assembly protein SufD n=1 Tax=Paenibacillus baekrokdamisoli TaxID=1712516 RepID=A0A3G9JE99_9BACL|nr:Fe-S cluster assembly protein SufD [Paenibacillus baekrokdamisoli]MBB3071106.1 Fe-S cluster assembly protein SufD [Paenibacillus baekrokdamisoli]BBH21524.1 FeS cluster assembly protein SufD [Paenibacillus baekrokdamisoli]